MQPDLLGKAVPAKCPYGPGNSFFPIEKRSAFHCAFNILFYTGIREGDLLALTPEDIPRDEAIISINKNYG
jgi:integrase